MGLERSGLLKRPLQEVQDMRKLDEGVGKFVEDCSLKGILRS
jgi:hypothetical protein